MKFDVEARRAARPEIAYDESLPVNARRAEISEAIRKHQVVVICGETGSGKTTQLPKICLELGRGLKGLIGHTQPRRIAARATASRIAQELKSELGKYVGYKIRFTDKTTPSSYIKLMTDGILLAETQTDPWLATKIARAIGSPRFRTYVSDDIIGVQLGGALKNVFGIAGGITLGRQLGNSGRATLLARCLAEMSRLGLAMGACEETFMGLSGVGDLTLCCNSPSSRNMSLGMALGEGRKLQDILAERVTVQEGVHSAESVAALARSHALAMPIAMAVDRVLNHGAEIDETIAWLLGHPVGLERVSAVIA